MNSNTFYVIELINEAGKSISYARKIPNCYNLVGIFKPMSGFKLLSVNACDTWREAQEIARDWNDRAIKNGRYAF
jgi:hypothetical protein